MTHPILNIAELEFHPWGHGEPFEARLGDIGKKRQPEPTRLIVRSGTASMNDYWEGEK